jgi:hypothetical protein
LANGAIIAATCAMVCTGTPATARRRPGGQRPAVTAGDASHRFILITLIKPDLITTVVADSLDWLRARAELHEAPIALTVLPEHLPLISGIATPQWPRYMLQKSTTLPES